MLQFATNSMAALRTSSFETTNEGRLYFHLLKVHCTWSCIISKYIIRYYPYKIQISCRVFQNKKKTLELSWLGHPPEKDLNLTHILAMSALLDFREVWEIERKILQEASHDRVNETKTVHVQGHVFCVFLVFFRNVNSSLIEYIPVLEDIPFSGTPPNH